MMLAVIAYFPIQVRIKLTISVLKAILTEVVFAGVQRQVVVAGGGPHQLHPGQAVLQPQAAGQRHRRLQAPPDCRQQAVAHAAERLPQGIPLCLQGE